MSIEPVLEYAKARTVQLKRNPCPSEHALEELRLIIALCEGLIKQEELILSSLPALRT